jgi:predicted deacylase
MGKKVFLQSIGLARMLGFHWAIETDKNAGYQLQKCLSGRLITEGIPAITIELGGPLYVHEEFRYKGVNALWSMLKNFQMVRGSGKVLDISEPQRAYYFDERVKTQSTGIIHYKIMPGKKIYAGQILGKVRNIFGETIEIIRSKSEGILFSHEDQSICFPGQTLFTTAVEKKFVL